MSESQKSETRKAVLSYLVDHPDAQDTLEGIVEWWLVVHMIETHTKVVKEAVTDLTSQRLLLGHQGTDLCTRYRINRSKVDEIKQFLAQGTA